MKVFLDTNILASGLATRGLCSDVVRTVLELHELVVSERMLGELKRILHSKFDVPEDAAIESIWLLRQDSICGDDEPLIDVHIKDKDDIPILSAAKNAGSEVFITGDAEVRAVGKVGSMRIISPRQFWDELRGEKHQ
jgi:uncharacterized protein